MELKFLATNGGPHPAKLWAQVTAQRIIHITEGAQADLVSEGKRLEADLIDVLEAAHTDIQKVGQAALKKAGKLPESIEAHVKQAIEMIHLKAQASKFAAHFRKPETLKYLAHILTTDFATSLDIERQWHKIRSK